MARLKGAKKAARRLNNFIAMLPKVSKKAQLAMARDFRRELAIQIENQRRWPPTGRKKLKNTIKLHSPDKKTTILYTDSPRRFFSADRGTPGFVVEKYNPLGHTWKPQQGKSGRQIGIREFRGNQGPPYLHVPNRPLRFIEETTKKVIPRWRKKLANEFRYKKVAGG